MENREAWLAGTLVAMVDELVDEFDLMDLLWSLVRGCARFVGDAEVGLVLDDQRGRLRPTVASSERVRVLELLESQGDQGPCFDAYQTGAQVLNCALDDEAVQRWPVFAPRAAAAGFSMVHAFPMRCRDQVLGALNVFQAEPHHVDAEAAAALQAMADTATLALVQDRAAREAGELAAQLERVLQSRVTIDQATGIVAERDGLDVDEALEALEAEARAQGTSVVETAATVVMGRYRGPART